MRKLNWEDDKYEIMCPSCGDTSLKNPNDSRMKQCHSCGKVYDIFEAWGLAIDTKTEESLDIFEDYQNEMFGDS